MIICIGDGSSTSDIAAQEVAQNRSMKYYGVLDASTGCKDGVYHTSKYDISPQQLADIINKDVEIVVLANADSELVAVSGQNSILEYMKTNKSFCAMAWTSTLRDQNQIRLCCYQKGHISNLDNVKSDMLKGKPISYCEYCTKAEQFDRRSPRIQRTAELAEMISANDIDNITSVPHPVDYDIRIGNRCNAMCRMCSASDSHLIDKEYSKLGIVKTQLGIIPSTGFDIVDLQTIKKLYVAGGEPTITQEFLDFLEKCIQQNRTDFLLQINTNAFVLSKKFLDLIKQFSNVQFIVSVDGFGDALYYIRYPITWDKLTKNIEQLNKLGDICFNHSISIYNIGNMYRLFGYFDKEYPTKTSLINYVDTPDYLWFGNHPSKYQVLQEVKRCKTLESYKTNTSFHKDIDHIEQTILTHKVDQDLLNKFYVFNDLLDKSRNLKLADYMPELVKENIV